MNSNEKLQLQKMISENNVEDQTELIRCLKHSSILRDEVNKLMVIKQKYANASSESTNVEQDINLDGMVECNFLFTYYTDIYNKVRKDEIDHVLLFQLLDILQKIEDNVLDQHEASYEVGTILKKIYIDSALKKAEKLDAKYASEKPEEPIKEVVNIDWKTYKAIGKPK
jgi:hypothetical protein